MIITIGYKDGAETQYKVTTWDRQGDMLRIRGSFSWAAHPSWAGGMPVPDVPKFTEMFLPLFSVEYYFITDEPAEDGDEI